ncbi:YwaF family protein [Solicola gregarius]|uniref:TIGR02206 family membrane protein n=1 Tax=Solicola gregarius TaxID=2908642 RepID=A0AA46YMA8_9ACTN|nr:TIGR02206 family membrane protein [Solicola gregarius]UYM06449.1 TIGR02206 family membrane protein [Solicola gregarius]
MDVWAAEDFATFGGAHLAVLGVFVVGAFVLVAVGRAQRGTSEVPPFSKVLAVLVPAVTVPLQVYQQLPGQWNLEKSLPLQLCDLAWISAAIALWTLRPWAIGLTYFWGLTLTTQAVATPDLGSTFPEPSFLMYWAMHLLIVWSAMYLTFGLGLGPTWRDYRICVLVTLAWAVAMLAFNALVGSNYGFLNGKPDDPSLLDLLGPWPVYLGFEIAIILGVWALMTWPWVVRQRGSEVAVT